MHYACVVWGGGYLVAQNQTTKEQKTSFADNVVYDLGRIEVTDKARADNNAVMSTITSQDIDNSSATDVAAALRFTPGVFYQAAGSSRGEPSLSIRGYGTTHIGFFLDGIPVMSIYDRQTDYAQFSSFGISEISVSKGYTSPLYGMNTMGGAINIITSKPKDKLEIHAKYNFLSNNENQVAASVGGNMGKYYYQLSYSYVDRDSYNLSAHFTPTIYQAKGEKLNSYYKNHTLRAKVGFEPNENHEYSLNVVYQKGEKGGMLDANSGGRFWDWPHYDKLTAYLLGTSKFTDKLSLQTRIYYDSFYNVLSMRGNYRGNGIISGGFVGDSIYNDYTLGGIFTLGYDFDENKALKVGLNLKNDNHKATDVSGATRDVSTLSDFSTSIFAEYGQRINDIFRFVVSGSYDRNDMLRVIIDGDRDRAFSMQGWTLQGILYANINEYVMLHANVGKKSKLPTLKDRYSTTWGNRTPNPDIAPESALNYELGVSFEYDDSRASLAVFYNDINNMLISVSDTSNSCIAGVNCSKLINAKEGYAYGAEVAFSQGLFDNTLSINANYTYIERKATNPNGNSYGVDGSRILDYPNHLANIHIAFMPLKQLDFLVYAIYQSKMWFVSNNLYAQNNDIFLIDLKINYRPISSLQLSLGAYNLLDRNYYYNAGYYQPGRRILAGVEYRF